MSFYLRLTPLELLSKSSKIRGVPQGSQIRNLSLKICSGKLWLMLFEETSRFKFVSPSFRLANAEKGIRDWVENDELTRRVFLFLLLLPSQIATR